MEYAELLFDTVKKTLRHSLIYGLGTSFMAVAGIILIPLYTRFLSPAEYGVYSLISIIFTLLIFVYDFGMVNALFRWVYQYNESQLALRKRVITTTSIFLVVLASLLTAVLWYNSGLISRIFFSNTDYSFLIQLMLIAIFLQSLTWVPLSILRIEGRAGIYTAIIISGMAVMIISSFLLLSSGRGIKSIFEAYILSSLFIIIPLYYINRKSFCADFSYRELGDMLKFGLPLFPVLFFSWIIDFSGRYFIGRFSTLNEVGLYSIGYKIGQILYLAEKTFTIAWTPIMLSVSQRYLEKAPRIFGKVFTYFIFLAILLCLAASVFCKEIVVLFTSPAYYGAAAVVPLIAFSYLLYGVYIYMLSGLIITKNISVQPLILFAAAILNVALNIMLVPRFGMMGSAYAAIASYFTVASTTYYVSQRFYPIPVELRRVVVIAASGFVVYLLSTFINFSNIILSVFSKMALMAVFFLLLFIQGFFKSLEPGQLKLIFSKEG